MSTDEQYCNNCKKHIPSVNFVLHEAHCKRGKHKQDNVPVQRSTEEQVVVCDEAESMSKPKNCAFCELQMPQCDLPLHSEESGCQYLPPESPPSFMQNGSDNQFVGASSLDRHGVGLINNTSERTIKNTTNRKSEVNSQNDDDPLSLDAVPLIPESSSEKPSDNLPEYEGLKQVRRTFSIEKQTDSDFDFKIKKYKDLGHMPLELKCGYKDAVILSSENDLYEVQQFRKSLENKILLFGRERPKIALFREIEVIQGNRFRALEFALERCTFFLLFITSSFIMDTWVGYSSETCLLESISNPNTRWSVVPVFTDKLEKSGYKIPISINTLKGVTYCSGDDFHIESIRQLFEDRISVRKNKELGEKVMQREWVFMFEEEMHQKEIREKEGQLRAIKRIKKLNQQKANLDHSLSMQSIAPPPKDAKLPTSGAGIAGSKIEGGKVPKYVKEIHHHHHHNITSPGVKVCNIQIGRGNTFFTTGRASENHQYSEEVDEEEDEEKSTGEDYRADEDGSTKEEESPNEKRTGEDYRADEDGSTKEEESPYEKSTGEDYRADEDGSTTEEESPHEKSTGEDYRADEDGSTKEEESPYENSTGEDYRADEDGSTKEEESPEEKSTGEDYSADEDGSTKEEESPEENSTGEDYRADEDGSTNEEESPEEGDQGYLSNSSLPSKCPCYCKWW